MEEPRHWPFPIVKPEAEWSSFDRDCVDFMRTAHAEGFQPRARWGMYAAAESPAGRSIEMIFRGRRNGWEVLPREPEADVPLGPTYGLPSYACVWVRPPFSAAAHFALEWLRGRELSSLVSEFDFDGKRGIALRSTDPSLPHAERSPQ